MASRDENAVDRWIRAVNAHDLEAMVECFHEDFRSEQPVHPEASFVGREQLRKNWATVFATVPNIKLERLRSLVSGGEIWTELSMHGNKPDGGPITYQGMAVWGIEGDRIAWTRLYLEVVQAGGPGAEARLRDLVGSKG